VIGLPFDDNDLNCLGWLTEMIVSLMDPPNQRILDVAKQFKTTAEAADWIRGLPQRNDDGIPGDGWKLAACRPEQRLEILSKAPNCFERAATWMLLAEHIDPRPIRRLATIDYPWGRHTFPIEDGIPIVLDPRVTYEELAQATPAQPEAVAVSAATSEPSPLVDSPQTLDPRNRRRSRMVARNPTSNHNTGIMPPSVAHPSGPYDLAPAPASQVGPVAIDVGDAIDFTAQLAQQGAAATRNGPSRAYAARNAIHDVVEHGTAPTDPKTIESIGWFFSVAEKVATDYGPRALRIVRTTALAISDLIDDIFAQRQRATEHARNFSFKIGGTTIGLPSWLTDAGSVVGKIGLDVGALALAPKLAALGISGQMLELVEQELNAEGLSLGPLKDPKRSFTSALSSLQKRAS
jgi:hypothetical protein